MLTRLKQVLGSDEQDELTADALRRFWSRAKPLSSREAPTPEATVVDLAGWVRARRDGR